VLPFTPKQETKPAGPPPPKPKQTEEEGGILPWFRGAAKLSAAEVAKFNNPLVEALMHAWPALDEFMAMTNPRHVEPDIWKNMDRDETQALVNAFLRLGASSEQAATVVRGVVNLWYQLQWGIILWPRFKQSMQFYLAYGFGLGQPQGMLMAGVQPFQVHVPNWPNPNPGASPMGAGIVGGMGGSNGQYPG
jgi:hypothetical protein